MRRRPDNQRTISLQRHAPEYCSQFLPVLPLGWAEL